MKSEIKILTEKREFALQNAEKFKDDSEKYQSFIKYADNLLEKIDSFDESDNQTQEYLIGEKFFNPPKYKCISLSYTDTYTSKYRYGLLTSTNQCFGESIYKRLERCDWEKQNHESNISEKNDNRMDRYYGFSSSFKHKELNITVNVSSDVSATGKTKRYTFSTSDIENEEEFKKLLLGF